MNGLAARLALAIGGSTELSLVLKATVVVALTIAAARLAGRARASVRHVLLASAFGALLMLPLVSVSLPPLAVELPIAPAAGPDQTLTPPGLPTVNVVLGRAGPTLPAGDRHWTVSTGTLVRALWALGALVFLLPLPVAMWRLRRLRRSALPWTSCEALVRTLALDAGVRRPIDLLIHEAISAPLTCGFVRPAIVLPADAREWSEADLRHAIVHELEHIRRGDWAVHLAARAVCALYWFHPFVWTAWRHLGLEAERACDDAVLGGAERTAYAAQLVMLAQRLSATAAPPMLSMANRSDLFARVSAVLDRDQQRGRAGPLRAAAIVFVASACVLAISPLRAVAPPRVVAGSGPAFVASVKASRSQDRLVMFHAPGDRYEATNVTLHLLIRTAFLVQDAQIVGGPGWLDTDRFDISAKSPAAGAAAVPQRPGPGGLQSMMQAVLADRFKFRAHYEIREMPVHALVVARADGMLGPQIHTAAVDCEAFVAARGRNGIPPPPPPPPVSQQIERPRCGTRIGPGVIAGGGLTMSQVADTISVLANNGAPLDGMVVDRTGLTGRYDLDLRFAPTDASIFAAMQQQLGLKLDAQRGPVQVLVVDRVEQPTRDGN